MDAFTEMMVDRVTFKSKEINLLGDFNMDENKKQKQKQTNKHKKPNKNKNRFPSGKK